MDIDINGMLTLDQREQLNDAFASTYAAEAIGDQKDELEALRDFRDVAAEILGLEPEED